MIAYKGLRFEVLKKEDIDVLTEVMTRAFDEDSRIHLGEDKGGPEGYDNGDFLRKFALHKDSEAYTITSDSKAVGCVIVWINTKTQVNFLGCVFIDTELQNKGVGKAIWEFVEKQYPDTIKWCTETPVFSRRNHNFYVNKCGFHVVRIDHPMDLREGSFIMEKVMK